MYPIKIDLFLLMSSIIVGQFKRITAIVPSSGTLATLMHQLVRGRLVDLIFDSETVQPQDTVLRGLKYFMSYFWVK